MTVSTPPVSRVRRWWPMIALLAGVLVVGTGLALGLRAPAASTRVVALVNEDGGAEGIGARVVDTLQQTDTFTWELVDAATASSGDYLAAVTIPEDFSDAVASLGTATPRQAELAVRRGADADADEISRLTATVSEVTSATGIRNLLSGMASARSQLQQAMMPAQLLTAATAAAETQAQQMLGGAKDVLPYLQTANDGANQLVDVAGQVSGMVEQARGPATELSTRLTELGVTLGDVTTTTGRVERGLDAVAARVAGVDPGAAADVKSLSGDLSALTRQLTAITGLLGTGVGPDTDLGGAIAGGFGQLETVSSELSSAGVQLQSGIGPIAAQAPELLGETTDQILAGVTQLKAVSAQLGTQLTKGVAAIPARSGAVQDSMSATMAAPVTVVETGDPAGSGPVGPRALMIAFAATTLVLGAALAWTGTRRTRYHGAAASAGS